MSDTQLTLREVRGLLNDLNIKLSGKDSEKWLRSLKRYLREENPWENMDFFMPLRDEDLPGSLKPLAQKWRQLVEAIDPGYRFGPVAWRVRAGFTLRQHAPKLGPCNHDLEHLRDIKIKNDEMTTDGIVFWIPCLLLGSAGKGVDEQMKLLAETRKRFGLPAHHLASFGSPAYLAGLILTHLKRWDRWGVPYSLMARTDALYVRGTQRRRLEVGYNESRVLIASWSRDDSGDADGSLGCFVLGMETIRS